MKKKLFLSIIPLCVLMSACSSVGYGKVFTRNDSLEELDTDTDEFLDAKIECLDPVVTDTGPVIGVQHIDGNNTVSIRFVGLVKLTDKNNDGKVDDDDLSQSGVSWNRTFYYPDGTVKRASSNKTVSMVYEAIAANGSKYHINTYNNEHSTNYTHFVTYVVRNIPNYNEDGNILMKLTANGTTSKIVCSSTDGYTTFSFDESLTGYFAIKKLASGGFEVKKPVSYYMQDCPYYARFEGFERASTTDGDGYLIIYKRTNSFDTYGYKELELNTSYNYKKYKRLNTNGNWFQSTASSNNTPHIGSFVTIVKDRNDKIVIQINNEEIKRIAFRTSQPNPTRFPAYVAAYRLLLEFHNRETIANSTYEYKIFYEEKDMELVHLTGSNAPFSVLLVNIYSSFKISSSGSENNLKWWSLSGVDGYNQAIWPTNAYYANGDIKDAINKKLHNIQRTCALQEPQ